MAPRVRHRRARAKTSLVYTLDVKATADPEIREEAARRVLEWLTRPADHGNDSAE